eukprot:29675-Pelagococcus_subviridis.AAC.7
MTRIDRTDRRLAASRGQGNKRGSNSSSRGEQIRKRRNETKTRRRAAARRRTSRGTSRWRTDVREQSAVHKTGSRGTRSAQRGRRRRLEESCCDDAYDKTKTRTRVASSDVRRSPRDASLVVGRFYRKRAFFLVVGARV